MNKTFFLTFLVFLVAGLTSCNTVGGLGKDIERAGQTISGAAKDKDIL